MRVIACIEDPVVIQTILAHLKTKEDTCEPFPSANAEQAFLLPGVPGAVDLSDQLAGKLENVGSFVAHPVICTAPRRGDAGGVNWRPS